ncbi:MAG: Hsp20/alpha crystallin family protein [Leptolyngbya sp. SIO4C1]|nr:Hsp20/alpha crystallin family protein [Leptolyngbya sp. SIO4C1]
MIVRYWQPFQELETLQRQLDRMFDQVAEPVSTTWTPAISLIDNGDSFVAHLQLPAVDAEKIDIQASRKAVAVSGERHAPEYGEAQRVLHSEFHYGTFRRVISLPTTIQHDQVSADYSNGMLTLTLPKSVEARNRVVKVNVNTLDAAEQPAIEVADADSNA